MNTSIRTRFAPSPTGYLHIGGVRTALFSWLFAMKHGGQFILRIEDTDRERSTEQAIQVILEGMQWLGLQHDEGPFYQSKRMDRYQEIIETLLAKDAAYYCYCSRQALDEMRNAAMSRGEKPKYDGRCRNLEHPPTDIKPVVRFKNPLNGEVIIEDLIQGRVVYQNSELDDLIIARSDGTPTYNLTVVVDDLDMKISHVIRGDDHLNNTPRQVNIFTALEATSPQYAHVPLILGEDGKRLSKRHGAASVLDYMDQGYLPDALLNYLVRLGWSHGDQEIFTRDDMINLFEITDINKSSASINNEKLLWLNQHYLKNADSESLAQILKTYFDEAGIDTGTGPELTELVEVQKQRTHTMVEIVEQSRYFFEDFENFDLAATKKYFRPAIQDALKSLREKLSVLTTWNNQEIHQAIIDTAEKFETKLGKLAQPLRVAVTGTTVSPSIDDTLRLLGQEKSLQRIDKALKYIENHASA